MKINLKAKQFVTAFKQVANSVSSSEMGVLGCVCLKVICPSMVELVATDGNQLTIRRLEIENQVIGDDYDENKYLIRNPKQIAKFLNPKSKFLELEFGSDSLSIIQDGMGIDLELSDYQYPKYEQLIEGYQTMTLDTPLKTHPDTVKIQMSRKYLELLMKNFTSTNSEVIRFEIVNSHSSIYISNKYYKDVMEFDLLMPISIRE